MKTPTIVPKCKKITNVIPNSKQMRETQLSSSLQIAARRRSRRGDNAKCLSHAQKQKHVNACTHVDFMVAASRRESPQVAAVAAEATHTNLIVAESCRKGKTTNIRKPASVHNLFDFDSVLQQRHFPCCCELPRVAAVAAETTQITNHGCRRSPRRENMQNFNHHTNFTT